MRVCWLLCGFLVMTPSAFARGLLPFRLGLSVQAVSTELELQPLPSDSSHKLTYKPGASTYTGIVMGYHWLGGTLSFQSPQSIEDRALHGSTSFRDYRLTYYTQRLGVELNYNVFQGYYISNSETLSSAALNGKSYYQLPDMKMTGGGVTLISALGNTGYSLASAIDQTEIQDAFFTSSWVLFLSLREQKMSHPSSVIPLEKQTYYGEDSTLSSALASNLGASLGYGAQWSYGAFFLSPLLAFGTGIQKVSYTRSDGDFSQIKASFRIHLRAALGLNADHYFAIMRLGVDSYAQSLHSLQLSSMVNGVTIQLGARF